MVPQFCIDIDVRSADYLFPVDIDNMEPLEVDPKAYDFCSRAAEKNGYKVDKKQWKIESFAACVSGGESLIARGTSSVCIIEIHCD